MKKLTNKKGFTLMEMLIVIAIIVILVAISVPTFTSQVGEANNAADEANLRNAKAQATIEYLDDENFDGGFYNASNSQFQDAITGIADYGKNGDRHAIKVTITDGVVDAKWYKADGTTPAN